MVLGSLSNASNFFRAAKCFFNALKLIHKLTNSRCNCTCATAPVYGWEGRSRVGSSKRCFHLRVVSSIVSSVFVLIPRDFLLAVGRIWCLLLMHFLATHVGTTFPIQTQACRIWRHGYRHMVAVRVAICSSNWQWVTHKTPCNINTQIISLARSPNALGRRRYTSFCCSRNSSASREN